ncbi:hypothetical protein GGR33_005121 [Methylobacterium brachythecii]|uniref:Uncharacterized protein n=1 Tax=Methylobacterium brachythecii TaxID=1176177 RepID=A0A7W6AS13_9HYPH|nr:hypothetical protein [Methylobacterium brachythecii]GLS46569.1 hypothetical protein GCM10007884_45630 [Methylobacterium brachythecii]
MVASLDRAAFYVAVRKTPFGGSLSQKQVDGLNALLDACPPAMETSPLAYCLATTKWETGHAMWPVSENLNYSTAARIRQVWPSRFPTEASAQSYVRNPQSLANKVYGGRLGNKLPNDGWDFRGMGDFQATGRDNARRATGRLQDLAYLTKDQDLVVTPTLLLYPFIVASHPRSTEPAPRPAQTRPRRPCSVGRAADHQHLDLGRHHIEALGHVLAYLVQGARAARAGGAVDVDEGLDPQQMGRQRPAVRTALADP